MTSAQLTVRFRVVMGVFIFGLLASGITAFPLRWELGCLSSWLGIGANPDLATLTGLKYWIAHVREGLEQSGRAYPFLAYGTDWLAFAHIVIAVFFVGPFCEPAKYEWTLLSGLIACAAVIPLALICGSLREIPLYWRLIDCSFGVFGAFPLIYCLAVCRKLQRL